MQHDDKSRAHGAYEAHAVSRERVRLRKPERQAARDDDKNGKQMDPSAGHFDAQPHRLLPGELHEEHVGRHHQAEPRPRKGGRIPEDQREQIEPFEAAMQKAEQAEHAPRHAARIAFANGEANGAEQDKCQAVEKEDEVELCAEKCSRFYPTQFTLSLSAPQASDRR